ncbi:MAG: MHO_1590 family protein [Metamycoplasmataceae bacterium]
MKNKFYFFYKKIVKYKVYFFVSIFLSSLIVGGTLMFLNWKKVDSKEKINVVNIEDNKKNEEIDENNIFPEIKIENYYNLLEYKDNEIIIGDLIIEKIIKDVASRIKISPDKFLFKILKKENNLLAMEFLILKNNHYFTKIYNLEGNIN